MTAGAVGHVDVRRLPPIKQANAGSADWTRWARFLEPSCNGLDRMNPLRNLSGLFWLAWTVGCHVRVAAARFSKGSSWNGSRGVQLTGTAGSNLTTGFFRVKLDFDLIGRRAKGDRRSFA